MIKRRTKILLGLIAVVVMFIAWPSPIDAVAYQPPQKLELSGALAPNDALTKARRIGEGALDGPEDVFVDVDGTVLTGTKDGRIVRVTPASGDMKTIANTGGRPLGIVVDARDGSIVVADADKGVLRVSADGATVTALATEAEGVRFAFTDHLVIARDGTIYFSDASSKYGKDEYLLDALEARPNGRVLAIAPGSTTAKVVVRDLCFANGVALADDESFLLINETYRYRIHKHWLTGEKAGTTEVLIDNLPGFPDNLSRSPRGTFWVAMFTVRKDLLDAMHPMPFSKELLAKLPKPLWPKPRHYGLVIEMDASGRVLRSLHDPTGENMWIVTGVVEKDGVLTFGSLHNNWIAQLPI